MAFGISPKYSEKYFFENIDKDQFLAIAADTALLLGWNVGFYSRNGIIAFTKMSMSSWSEKISILINEEETSAIIKSECTGNQLYDWNKNKENVQEFLLKMKSVQEQLSEGELLEKVLALREKYTPQEIKILSNNPIGTKERITSFFALFIPTDGYFVTPILININLLIFSLMVISGVSFLDPDIESLLKWGGNFRALTLDGQWWRLLTSIFLHIGILHLLMNMYALIYIGLILEPYLGKTRFFIAYILAGIAASTASLWWHSNVVSAGASGAIFGMYGLFLALLTTNLVDKSIQKAFLTSTLLFIVYSLLSGMEKGVDNAAHIGGLVSGLAIGFAFVPSLKNPEDINLNKMITGLTTASVLTICMIVYKNSTNDMGRYIKDMERFIAMESMALEVFMLSDNTPKNQILSELKDRGIYYWRENLILIEGFDELDLPVPIRKRNRKLKEYCQLRIESYQLLYNAVNEDTNKYQDQIAESQSKIDKVMQEIKDMEPKK